MYKLYTALYGSGEAVSINFKVQIRKFCLAFHKELTRKSQLGVNFNKNRSNEFPLVLRFNCEGVILYSKSLNNHQIQNLSFNVYVMDVMDVVYISCQTSFTHCQQNSVVICRLHFLTNYFQMEYAIIGRYLLFDLYLFISDVQYSQTYISSHKKTFS